MKNKIHLKFQNFSKGNVVFTEGRVLLKINEFTPSSISVKIL